MKAPQLITPERSGSASGAPLGEAAVSGVIWQTASFVLGKLLILVSTIILARLLLPRDFGLVGLALVFITYADVVTDLGVAQALVFFPSGQRRSDAAVVVCLAVSLLFAGIAIVLAPQAAAFFGHPEVTAMFQVLSISLVLRASGQVPDALLRKGLRFRSRLKADVYRSAVQGLISIALALLGLGPWAIIYGYLAGSLIWTAVVWALVDFRLSPDFWRIRRATLSPLLIYGLPAAASTFLLTLVFNVDYLIVGRILGAQALGLYTLGFRIPELLIINLFSVLSVVAFPLYRLASDQPGRIQRGYLFGLRLQAVFGVAAGVELAVLAPMVVHVLFGPRWEGAIVPLEALALYAAFRSLGVGPNDVFRAIGRPGLLTTLSLVRLAAVAPALVAATAFGINGVSWAQAAVALPLAIFMQAVASRILGIPFMRLLAAIGPSVAVGVAVAFGAGMVRVILPGPEAMRLVVSIITGSLSGLVALYVADPRFVRESLALVTARGGRNRGIIPASSQGTA